MRKTFFMLAIMISAFSKAGNMFTVTNNELVLPNVIGFDAHAYDVKSENDPMLDYVAEYLLEHPNVTKFVIEGHAFTEKNASDNMKLSLQRAAMVSYYLTERGVSCDRLAVIAYGENKPIAPTDECNLLVNTRINFINLEFNNKPVQNYHPDPVSTKEFNPCD
ncbi:MAG TPA: OmpA family protein [Chitinophagales bacterium]|nr:OmpA family protein [Chitinophagales bacterium]